MTTVTVDIPDSMRTKFKAGSRLSFHDFTTKIFGTGYISPDLMLTPIEDLSEAEKKELIEARNYDKSKLLNI